MRSTRESKKKIGLELVIVEIRGIACPGRTGIYVMHGEQTMNGHFNAGTRACKEATPELTRVSAIVGHVLVLQAERKGRDSLTEAREKRVLSLARWRLGIVRQLVSQTWR